MQKCSWPIRWQNFKTLISQKLLENVDFLHAGTYLSYLQIDDVILSGPGQACPGMLKEAIKTIRSQKLKEVCFWEVCFHSMLITANFPIQFEDAESQSLLQCISAINYSPKSIREWTKENLCKVAFKKICA